MLDPLEESRRRNLYAWLDGLAPWGARAQGTALRTILTKWLKDSSAPFHDRVDRVLGDHDSTITLPTGLAQAVRNLQGTGSGKSPSDCLRVWADRLLQHRTGHDGSAAELEEAVRQALIEVALDPGRST